MARYEGVSVSVIRRLPRYHRFLYDLLQKDIHRISSRELAELMNLTASQIRQDLNALAVLASRATATMWTRCTRRSATSWGSTAG